MELQGTLCSGLGEGAAFTELDWVAHAFREKLGFAPHPGTVNLSLTGDAWLKARARMRQAAGIAITPPPEFCAAKCFAVRLNEQVDGFAVLPEVPDYPADKLEIVAPVFVRRELKLQDGDCVKLRIDVR
jgi:CTP-dependent riboflavin kinase